MRKPKLNKDLREAISQDDDEKIKTLTTDLQQALYTVSSNLYQQAGGAEAAGANPDNGDSASSSSSSSSDDVIDADFTETK
jgi:molecular chaperone DnaK